jgi:hypothetical protein
MTGKNRMTPRTSASAVPRNGDRLIEDVQAQINFGQTIRERRPEARGPLGMFDPRDMCHLQ